MKLFRKPLFYGVYLSEIMATTTDDTYYARSRQHFCRKNSKK